MLNTLCKNSESKKMVWHFTFPEIKLTATTEIQF